MLESIFLSEGMFGPILFICRTKRKGTLFSFRREVPFANKIDKVYTTGIRTAKNLFLELESASSL